MFFQGLSPNHANVTTTSSHSRSGPGRLTLYQTTHVALVAPATLFLATIAKKRQLPCSMFNVNDKHLPHQSVILTTPVLCPQLTRVRRSCLPLMPFADPCFPRMPSRPSRNIIRQV